MRRTFGYLLTFVVLAAGDHLWGHKADQESQPAAALPPPVELTAEQDHRRIMNLLHISSLRRGPDGNPASPNAANFDEAKANPYATLPDPLVLEDGTRVRDAATWWHKRRPEIVEDFDREIYGRVPATTPAVKWQVTATERGLNGDTPVVTKALVGHVDNRAYPLVTVDLQLTLTTPANARGAVPVMLELGFGGRRPGPVPPGPTWQQQVLARGWGYAVLLPTSVQADNGTELTRGIIGLVNRGQPRQVDDWGALRAWAWGASRALDYFETDEAVDAKRVGIEGLSRYGKAALVAMAYDERFAIGFIASSGAAGAKLHRRHFGEQVENVAGAGEYHWVAGNFLKYAGPLAPGDLPVDSHELIALCAPRPVFISAGSPEVEGGWVDAKGMFLAAVGAGPVYRLLGKKDLGTTEFPRMETALVGGDVAFRQHSGGHTAGPNWPTFLEFAGRYLSGPPQARVALTFDDLPVHGPLPAGLTRVDVVKSIIAALQHHNAPPTYGFINAKALDEQPDKAEVLRLWRATGFPLGNHTFSHMDLDANPVEAFVEDVIANEPALRSFMGDHDWHWFRFPYLREGETLVKRRSVAHSLSDRGYRVAEVTLNFDDWAYNDPYARCIAGNDSQAIEWLKQSYLTRAAASIVRGQHASRRLFGRDIKHVMLLHVGAFQTVMLPRLLDLLRQQGFELIKLEDAQEDPVYAMHAGARTNGDETPLRQVLSASDAALPGDVQNVLQTLAALCH
jgi:peptidoglycan/xylan/chitin deacetylase (PgdA/CDA1 family)